MAALAQGLQTPIASPLRSHFEPNGDASTLLIMPAWKAHQVMGVKLVSIWPGNRAKERSAVSGVYVLISCADGRALAVMDGTELTIRRTAAAAALAARLLARRGSTRLAVLGTGSLCVPLVLAHCQALPIERVLVWGRRPEQAQQQVRNLAQQGIAAEAQVDLQTVLAHSDVLAVATTATTPFIPSAWVQPGTHLGLIGAFTPTMAEAEPALLAQSRVFADNRQAVLQKGGEVVQALQQGLLQPGDIQAELAELAAMDAPTALTAPSNLAAHPQRQWRHSDADITVFKSVGFAALDLIAAEQVMAHHRPLSCAA